VVLLAMLFGFVWLVLVQVLLAWVCLVSFRAGFAGHVIWVLVQVLLAMLFGFAVRVCGENE